MITRKTIMNGLGAVLACLLFVVTLGAGKVFAQTTLPVTSASQITGANYQFKDRSTITATMGSVALTFYDSNISDTTYNYKLQGDYAFCAGSGDINVDASAFVSNTPTTANATINAAYESSGTAGSCSNAADLKIKIANAGSINKLLTWDNGNLITYSGLTLSPLPTNPNIYIDNPQDTCPGAVAVLKNGGATLYEFSGTSLDNTAASNFPDLKGIVDGNCGVSRVNGQAGNTGAKQNRVNQTVGINGTKNQPAPAGTLSTSGVGGSAANQSDNQTCEGRSIGFAEAWLLCPLLNAADDIANTLTNTFEQQLSFTLPNNCGSTATPTNSAARSAPLASSSTSNSSQSNGASVSTEGCTGLHNAWNVFRVIASSLLIIVMLVAIISEAIGSGPFDAYTIRKILPRIVAAIILIQISWPIFVWVINAVDALGHQLADIMYLPFGGTKNMDLGNLMSHAHISSAEAGGFSWILLIGVIIAAAVALPMVLLFCFLAIISLLTGLLVLIFRKIIIIMALIFAPLALVAWILPGTNNYWKMWWSNFLKALFMFPIVVAIIAGGRIFAYITATQGIGTLIAFLLVLVGFFGPLFILPKTFRWGGQLMQFAGKGAFSASGKLSEGPSAYFKNRQEGYKAERTRQSQERYQRDEGVKLNRNWKKGFGAASLWRRPIDLARSGQTDPLLWGRRREQAMTGYRAKGAESQEADVKAADARANLLFSQVEDHDSLSRAMAAGDANYEYKIKDEQGNVTTHKLGKLSKAEMQAGLNAVARFGGATNLRFLDKRIAELRASKNGDDNVLAKSFLDANVQSLQGKMKHFYYGANLDNGVDSLSDNLSENSFVGMEGAGMEAVLESLSKRAATGDADATRRLSRVMTMYEGAINNENIRPNINASVNQAMEAFVTGANIQAINGRDAAGNLLDTKGNLYTDPDNQTIGGRARFDHSGINRAAATIPALAVNINRLRGRIDPTGRIDAGGAPPPPPTPIDPREHDTIT